MMGSALSIAHDGIAKDLDGEDTLESRVAIEAFLREVETRAFRIAVMNVRDRDEALDIVQDCMIRLVRRYSGRPSDEWPRRTTFAAIFNTPCPFVMSAMPLSSVKSTRRS